MAGEFLTIQPDELKFMFELHKQISCSVRLTNNTHDNVAFKIKTTSPKKYSVRPSTGVILPQSICEIIITMQAQHEAPPDMLCKDKFLVQSVVAPQGAEVHDVSPDLFLKGDGQEIHETKLRVVYDLPPHSDVTKAEYEQATSTQKYGVEKGKSSILTEATLSATKDSQVGLGKGSTSNTTLVSGFSLLFVFLVGLLGILVGYLLHRTK